MNSETIKVLLIEDDEDDYILTRQLLADVKGGNYSLDWAPSYEEGLRIAGLREHHVCLVDYRLGEHSGVELIRQARKFGLTTPMILLTGHGNHDVDVEAIEAGATDYLVKDETPAARLERTIRYAVELNTERCRAETKLAERKVIELELEHARDAALESVRLKSEFLANMSHEIRTPMNGVIGMTELLLETDLSARQRKYTETIQSSSEALLRIIDDILDFSKIEAGRLRFEKIDFELCGPFEAAVESLADRAQAKGLELASLIDRGVPASLRGDPGRLRQVLTNLIGNAVKFTESGEVVVSVTSVAETATEATLRFEIKDSGIGIAPECQSGLFQAFTQADGSTTRKYGGTGLGLAISAQLVALMGGAIGVTSSFGAGSTFWFTASFQKQETRAKLALARPGKLSGARILLVDDNAADRSNFLQQMSSWGITVSEAESGERALELLRTAVAESRPYDIAALDLMTSEMDGFQLAEAIKSDPIIAPVQLLLLPSFGRRGDAERALGVGIAAYLPKPVRQSQLHSCLRAVLDGTLKDEDAAPTRIVTRHSLKESGVQDEDLILADIRIVVAEDNLVNQEVVLGQLANLGYRAKAFSNGRELIAALEIEPADIILMDRQMPEMDGFAATAEIRRREGTARHTIIIAMTANALAGDREKCLAAGMDAYLAKPVKSKTLKQIILTSLADGNLSAAASASSVPADSPVADESAIVDVLCLADTASTPEKLKVIIQLYLQHTAERLEELSKAVKEESAGDIYAIAHKCLGSSRSCGMTAIVPALAELQRMGAAGELIGASHQFEAAEAAFQKLTPFLELYIEQLPNTGGSAYA